VCVGAQTVLTRLTYYETHSGENTAALLPTCTYSRITSIQSLAFGQPALLLPRELMFVVKSCVIRTCLASW
jgi:hypothetical protein